LGPGWHSDRRPDRAYSDVDAGRIVQSLRERARDPQLGDVAELQRVAGLRRQEAVQLRGQDIDPDRCTLTLRRGTKGGKVRQVQVDTEHRGFLKGLKERADRRRDGHCFQGRGSLGKRLERAVDEACKRLGVQDQGTHGFRRTFAQRRYCEYCDLGLGDRQARRQLARDLGHGRIEVTYSYVA
jgi:integrase